MYHFERTTEPLPSRPFRTERDTSCVTCCQHLWTGALMATYRRRTICMSCATGLW